MTTTYPLAASTWGEEERRAILAVLDSGHTTMGPYVRRFEEAFAAMFGATYAVMVNSGSSANLLAVAAHFFTREPRLRAGQTAIVPAVSWATTYYPLTQYGLKLRFVDIDPLTLNFDLAALERALTDDVGVIFAVNLLGNPNDFSAIGTLIGERDILLLEDNCESMGATFSGRSTGTFGAIGTFSTFFSHHISTMEGGLCLTDDRELYEILLSLRSHGWTRHLPWPNLVAEPDPGGKFYEFFRFVLPGYNVRPMEIAAAVGLEQLAKFPSFLAQRRLNAQRFVELFSDMDGVSIQREVGESSWFGFAITLTDKAMISRDKVVSALAEDGFETRPIVAGNFARNPVIAHLPHDPPHPMPHADAVHDRGFYVGNHQWDVTGDLERLHASLTRVLKG
jgi:CDP-6-deoxy-D-xylo-4-hexulose-3-dehydrase